MDPIIILIACALIAWLFASSAWAKLQKPLYTISVIDNYDVLPFAASKPVVFMLAMVEMLIAVLVLLPLSRQWAALAAATLLFGYGVAIGINLARGRTDFDCGCGGPAARTTVAMPLLWRNTVLVLIAALAMVPASLRPLQWLDYSVVILAAAFLILIYQIAENLLANHQQLIRL